jgi:opacity protein-like surface antigen
MTMKLPITAGMLSTWLLISTFGMPIPVSAEWYVAGNVGVNFADRLVKVSGTGGLAALDAPDFDLANSISYGAKLGYFADHNWFGIEGEVLHSTPHIKSLDDDPGIHMRLTTIGVNFLARYPGLTFQPYIGVGTNMVIAHIGDTATVQSDTNVAPGWSLLAGLRAFLTPHIAVYTEYRHTGATLQFNQAFGPGGGFEGGYRAQHVMVGLSYHF